MVCEMIWKMVWFVQNTSGVVLNDNENGKILGPHALLGGHALGDTLYPSW